MSANGDKVPSGLVMMLKAMGIEFDPKMFKTMADAVIEIRDRLRRIEKKLDQMNGADDTLGADESPFEAPTLSAVNSQEEKSNAPNR